MKIDYDNLAFDLDGTLLNDDGRICEKTLSFLRQEKKSKTIIMVSGRNLKNIFPIANAIGIKKGDSCFLIALGGSVIFDYEHYKIISLHTFEKKAQRKIVDYLNIVADKYYSYTQQYSFEQLKKTPPLYKIKNFLKRIVKANRFVAPQSKITEYCCKYQIFDISKHDFAALSEFCNIYHNVNEIEILPLGVNKFSALEELQIDLDRTIYFGDSENDVNCLRHLPFSVAMQNAPDNIKNIAKFITASDNNNDGIYNFLMQVEGNHD